MATQRILRGTAGTLSFNYLDADGKATNAVGALTVGVVRGDGTTLIAAGTATTAGTPAGRYTAPITATQTATLDRLTATWTDAGNGAQFTTTHEIVGGYLFSVAEAQAFPGMGAQGIERIVNGRSEVEDELEQLRNAAFVPRYDRIFLNGNDDVEIITGRSWLRVLRTAKVLSTTGSSSTTAFTSTQLAACALYPDGRIRRGDGNVWPYGINNIVIEVEHGFTAWGADLSRAALMRLRERLAWPVTEIPDRATAYSTPDGYSYNLNAVAPDGVLTGNPYVDAVYNRYPRTTPGTGVASRTLSFEPQSGGVFRGNPISR